MYCVTAPMRADSFTMAARLAHLFPTVQVEVKHLVRREPGINVGKGGALLSMMARVTIKGFFLNFFPPTSFQLMAVHCVNAKVVCRCCRFSDKLTDLNFPRKKLIIQDTNSTFHSTRPRWRAVPNLQQH